MAKLKTVFLSLTMILALGLVFQPVALADNDPIQNSGSTQPGSVPIGTIVRIILAVLW